MGYRRNKARAQRWNRWRATYNEDLIRLPLPPWLYESEDRWGYFLDHGYHPDDPTGFVINAVTDAEAVVLLNFFEAQAAAGEYTGDLLIWLHNRRER